MNGLLNGKVDTTAKDFMNKDENSYEPSPHPSNKETTERRDGVTETSRQHQGIAPTDGATDPAIPEDMVVEASPSGNGDQAPVLRSDGSGVPFSSHRRSVQFSRPALSPEQINAPHTRSQSGGGHENENSPKDKRGPSFLTKLKAFANASTTPSQVRVAAEPNAGGELKDEHSLSVQSPLTSEAGNVNPEEDQGSAEYADADVEQSSDEDTPHANTARSKKKYKARRPPEGIVQTAPSTPKSPVPRHRPNMMSSSSSITPSDRFRPYFLPRRATTNDLQGESRQGVSEDEGRSRITRNNPWRKGEINAPRGVGYTASRKSSQVEAGDERRPSTFRRFTGFGTSNDTTESSAFSPWKAARGERTANVSAAKWRQLKTNLRMIGQRRKAENTIDHAKSAELLAELTAGVPAALILASMFQRDEHGNRRIPVLLEQLKVHVTDSRQVDTRVGDRHMIFRIEMEYGNGLTRMRWVIHRALRDFANLHARYKLQIGTKKYIQLKNDDSRAKLPHFPRSAFPYLRGIHGLDSESEDEDENEGDGTGRSGGEVSAAERSVKKKKNRPAAITLRRKSSGGAPQGLSSYAGRREAYPERQRKKLEVYLQQMIRYLVFRPESNRLCRFLELSALGVRLAAEGSYHGKEGLLVIQSGKGVDFRRAWTPSLIKGRHGPKWFSVRHSYVVCVDSPEGMNIYDVFLVDSSFRIQAKRKRLRDQKPKDMAKAAKESASHPQHHSLKLFNSERRLKLLAKNERVLHQFEESIKLMTEATLWSKPKRFDSFAPVRSNVFAQWLVDGRDYMWNVSRAISMAKDVIYIHDWWLSPELYMRRPAAISQKWRLDRLLQRKAREGVKIFVIIYRNINSAIPIDSEYTKFSLLDLHPNIFVQRSPNQFRQNTFFWAHHEKLCLIDHMVAFIGGIDLCFGRWDTPQHSVVDDKLTGFEMSDVPKDADHCQLWPGKDYSNPRVQDFYGLDKPYEEMYNRAKVPRMPWHDIHMQLVGQPARDLTRHFVQRWNYVLRQRRPTRPTPFLIPPPDFNPSELEALGLDGTCEIQVLRSACEWSLGTPNLTEHSIMNAYVKMIEKSDHFVYVENQFFITSCEVEGTRIENQIGDALVERIVRASQKGEDWRAVIVIPLMPGFQNTVDQPDGTSVRLIMQCQFRSICRGETSIFGRVRAQGIEPEDYIQFYSLRSWGKIGPSKQLVTEQLYIHAKCMIVDDRVAIIGSANINERSMLGSRDSECAAIVRDTDMLWSTMGGKPYMVGRFSHTLRMRLMREHLGVDVDEVSEGQAEETKRTEKEQDPMDRVHTSTTADREFERAKEEMQKDIRQKSEELSSFNHDVDWEQANNPNLKANRKLTEDSRVTRNSEHRKDVDGNGPDAMKQAEQTGLSSQRDTVLVNGVTGSREVLIGSDDRNSVKGRPSIEEKMSALSPIDSGNASLPPNTLMPTRSAKSGQAPKISQLPPLPFIDDTDIGGPKRYHGFSPKAMEILHPFLSELKQPFVDKTCMRDPLNEAFFLDTWHAAADNNTKLYRQVFRCMPDNDVKSWKEYKEYAAYAERLAQAQGGGPSRDRMQQEAKGTSGPPGQGTTVDKMRLLGPIGEKAGDIGEAGEKMIHNLGPKDDHNDRLLGRVEEWAEEASRAQAERQAKEAQGTEKAVDEKMSLQTSNDLKGVGTLDSDPLSKTQTPPSVGYSDALNRNASLQKRRRRATTRGSKREFQASDDIINSQDAEELLKMVQGHLVTWPYDWLMKEEQGSNWLYSIDGIAPLEI